jgi:hypothetical protein
MMPDDKLILLSQQSHRQFGVDSDSIVHHTLQREFDILMIQ